MRVPRFSAVNAHQYPKRHRMVIFMVMQTIHDNSTMNPFRSRCPFKRTALLVCTRDEYSQRDNGEMTLGAHQ